MILKRKKVLFITMGVIALVVGAVSLLLLNLQVFKPQIEAAASNALGMDVHIKGRLGIDLFPGFGISVKNVSVQKKGEDVVTAEKMRIGLRLIPLTRHEVLLSRIRLIKPVFSIVRYKNGRFNFEKPERTLIERLLTVNKVSISAGRLVYTDESSGERIKVDDFDGTIRDFSYGRTEGAGPLRNISFAGDIKCKTLTINNLTLTNLAVRTVAGDGILDINPVSMQIFDGTGKGSVHVDTTGALPRYRVITTLNKFRIEKLIQAYSSGETFKKSMEGTVNFSADLTATGKSMEEVKRTLNGDVSLSGDDLMLNTMDVDALIPKYERSQNFNLVDVGAYFLVGPFGPVITKSYNFGSVYEESLGGKGIIKKLVSSLESRKRCCRSDRCGLCHKKIPDRHEGRIELQQRPV